MVEVSQRSAFIGEQSTERSMEDPQSPDYVPKEIFGCPEGRWVWPYLRRALLFTVSFHSWKKTVMTRWVELSEKCYLKHIRVT